MLKQLLRCLGWALTLLLLVAAPTLYRVTRSESGGSTPAFYIAYAILLLGQLVATIRVDRVRNVLSICRTFPIRSTVLLLNLGLSAWLVVNVATRMGIILLLLAWGVVWLAIGVLPSQRLKESVSGFVRLSPLSFASVYLLLSGGELFLRYHPLLVGGGGGGNPALGRMYEGLYVINSRGFRGSEFSTTPPPGVCRVVMLGDSFTFGQGVAEGETYPARASQLLNFEAATRYEVINAGKSGTDTSDQLQRLSECCLELRPDLVTVQFYLNDLEPSMQATADPAGLVDHYLLLPARVSYAVFFVKYRFERLRDSLKSGLQHGSQDVIWVDEIASRIGTSDPGWTRLVAAVDGFAEVSRREQLPIVFFLLPHPGLTSNEGLRTIHKAVGDRIASAGLPVFDLIDVWADMPPADQIVSKIDNHPSAAAHARTAARIVRELRGLQLLKKDQTRTAVTGTN